jgi:putative oxidoreductase
LSRFTFASSAITGLDPSTSVWRPGNIAVEAYAFVPNGKGRTLLWDFLKNLSLATGFLLIVIGTDGTGLAPFVHAPFASSHPYGVQP